ncbi:MAG TPA: Mrp/NBP35 family ATP-binding protein [Methanothrix sp.]|nr:Mrp/NBP35 family ATP-binding protein [Methanothrix sp.]
MANENSAAPEEKSCDRRCETCQRRSTCSDSVAIKIASHMSRIKHKILVASGKGGTGKSTIAANLAVTLRRAGYRVGLLDADITGPDIPRLLGIEDIRLHSGPEGIEPADAEGIKVVSMALLLDSKKSAVVWRGPMKAAAIKQFLSDVNWGDLDFFIVDLPPGTSDEPMSLVQLMPDLSGALVVTTPQGVSLLDSRKAVTMFQDMDVPVLGLIENMSWLSCPRCGEKIEIFKRGNGEAAAKELGVDFLGSIPMDPEVGSLAEQGIAFAGQKTTAQEAFDAIVSRVLEKLLPHLPISEN